MTEWRDAEKPENCPNRDGLYMIRLDDGTEKAEFYSVIDGWATDEAVRWWIVDDDSECNVPNNYSRRECY